MVNLLAAQITGIVTLAMILSGIVAIEVISKTYYCASEDNVKECIRVSDSGITCYYLLAEDITKGDRCTGGFWELIQVPKQEPEQELVSGQVKVSANGKEWICETNNNFVDPYSKCKSGNYEGYLGELI